MAPSVSSLLGWLPQSRGPVIPIGQIRQLIEKLANSRAPVLLLGETGVGKEVITRVIHESNPSGNFVPIDCGSLVGPLMENELFGHTKGAFTGASEAKKGLIELANGGTAFFDEIGDLPLDLQVKLLRCSRSANTGRSDLLHASSRPASDLRDASEPHGRG